jgi:uncharacterized Zn-finger protein
LLRKKAFLNAGDCVEFTAAWREPTWPHTRRRPRNQRGVSVWCARLEEADKRPVNRTKVLGFLTMADHVVPHFQNDAGVSVIEIGATEFMCVGARPPFDHPHVFLDMGDDREIICPYCSTLYRHAPDLAAGDSRPPECALKDKAA